MLAATVLGCGGDVMVPPAELSASVAGRLERGAVVSLHAELDGRLVPPDSVSWTAAPAGAVGIVEGGRARLLRTGPVMLTAEVRGVRATVALAVMAPPVIVFDRVVDGNRDIWRVALDGGELTRLTDHPADDLQPTVAAGWVWFTSHRSGPSDLYRVPLAGGEVQRITTGGGRSEPAVSRDGGLLAFVRMVGGNTRVYTSTAAGAQERRVTAGAAHDAAVEAGGDWSPDGARLLFVSTAAGNAGIWMHTVPTNAFAPLFASPFADLTPTWSPDGTRIVYASVRGGQADLYIHTLADGQTTRLTDLPGSEGEPAWLADGRIVFSAIAAGQAQLMWIDPASPGAVHVIETGAGTPRNAAAVVR